MNFYKFFVFFNREPDEVKPLTSRPPAGLGDPEELEPLAGGSESDSLAEYEDTDPTKFNEDGSFIGAKSS